MIMLFQCILFILLVAVILGGLRILFWKHELNKYINDDDPAVRHYWKRFLGK